MSKSFLELFELAADAPPESALDVARAWAARRGRGEPSPEDVAREQTWESIVRAGERGASIEAEILGARAGGGWAARVATIDATIPAAWAAIADPPLAPGLRALRVLSYDRVTEELALRPPVAGEIER